MRTLILALLLGLALRAEVKVQKVDDAAYAKALKSPAGQVVLVNFWATWCGPCKKELPELLAMAKRLGPKFRLMLVSADEDDQTARVATYLKSIGYDGITYQRPLESAEEFIKKTVPNWNGGLPASVLYNKAGAKVKTYPGEVPFKTAEADIKKLM